MRKILSVVTAGEDETEAVAFDFAGKLKAGHLVALYGPVGGGKTCFVRGLARGLGCSQPVKSPSFSIINEYPGNPALFHIDFYRLEKDVEIADLGWTEYLDSDGVVAIEWAERVRNLLPERRFDVYLTFFRQDKRLVEIFEHESPGDR